MLVIAKTQKKHIKQILKKGIIFIGTKLVSSLKCGGHSSYQKYK